MTNYISLLESTERLNILSYLICMLHPFRTYCRGLSNIDISNLFFKSLSAVQSSAVYCHPAIVLV